MATLFRLFPWRTGMVWLPLVAVVALLMAAGLPLHRVATAGASGAHGLCCAPIAACCADNCTVTAPVAALPAALVAAVCSELRPVMWRAPVAALHGLTPAPDVPPPRGAAEQT